MKKLAITLCVLCMTSVAFAHIQAEDSATVESIRAQGFSEGMSHVTDTVRYNHSNGTAEAYYNVDPLADSTSEAGKWYTVVKRWLDPAQDDGLFGRHNITFTNDWFEMDSPFVKQDVKAKEAVQEEKQPEETVKEPAKGVPALDVEVESL